MDVFWINGWLFVHDVEMDTGTVYFPTGGPTLSVAAHYGRQGDGFPSKAMALAYFEKAPPETVNPKCDVNWSETASKMTTKELVDWQRVFTDDLLLTMNDLKAIADDLKTITDELARRRSPEVLANKAQDLAEFMRGRRFGPQPPE